MIPVVLVAVGRVEQHAGLEWVVTAQEPIGFESCQRHR